MITVRVTRSVLEVRGHAGYSDYGSDIVCAAASFLVLTAEEYFRRARERFGLSPAASVIEPGNAVISIPRIPELREAVKLIICGFEELQSAYPEYIRISGVRKKVKEDKNEERIRAGMEKKKVRNRCGIGKADNGRAAL